MSRTVRRRRSIVALPALGAAGVAAALVVGAVHGPTAAAGLVSHVTTTNQAGSMWAAPTAPSVSADSDPNAVEVGAKFSTNTAGSVTGVRFYKGRTNTGVHVADLWDSAGNKLASATFTGETASGWQSVNFASAVAIVPGTTYVVSYHTTTGHYAEQEGTFAGKATLSDGVVTETDGVYTYGSGGFPTQSWNNSSYYVQVAFIAGGVTTSAPTSPSATPSTPAPTPSATATPTTPAPSPSPSHSASPSPSHSPSPSPTTPAPSPSPSHSPSPSPSTNPPSPSPSTNSPSPSPSTNSPSPTSSASTPTGKTNCFAVPSACGYPDATNTGVPAGTTLTNSGSITLSQAGQTVTGLNVVGCVTITASNVTFEDSKVSGCTSDVGAISVSYGSQTGVLIDHVEITENGTPGIAGAGFTVNAANIHGTSDGIDVQNNDVVTNSYVHGLIVPPAAHVDSIQSAGGNALLVDHNTFDSACGSCNSAVILGADLGAFTGQQVVENNLLAGGAYTAFAGTGGYNATNMISFVNNRFVNDADYGQCSFNVAVAFTGNVMDNTDSPLSCSG